MGIVHDGERILLLHRSPAVRSAWNAWSLVTGLHEWGMTMGAQLEAELAEEFNLKLMKTPIAPMYTYESISPNGDGWHWVIMVFIARVETFASIKNMEPDKHDEYRLLSVDAFVDMVFDETVMWTPGLKKALVQMMPKITNTLERKY
jgi:ADP-ribose pyrophosphatase YjhB (NUDIX family)